MSEVKNNTITTFDCCLQDRELKLILEARNCNQELFFDDWGYKMGLPRSRKEVKFKDNEIKILIQVFGFKKVEKENEIILSFNPSDKEVLQKSLNKYTDEYGNNKIDKLSNSTIHATMVHLNIYFQFLKEVEKLGCVDKISNVIRFDYDRIDKYLKKDNLEFECFRFQEFLLQMEQLNYLKIKSANLFSLDRFSRRDPICSFVIEILKFSQEIENELANGTLIIEGHKIYKKQITPAQSMEIILRYDDKNRKIELNGHEFTLTEERYKTAKVLIDNADENITNEILQDQLGCNDVTVRQRISILRRKYFKDYIPKSAKSSDGYILNISPNQISKY